MRQLLFVVFLLCSTLYANSSVDESDLPKYLRGIGWKKVEAELRKDLRLSASVRPIHYDLNLNVSVSGYNNAKKSTYDGTVKITLNITAPVREIEVKLFALHYNGKDWDVLNYGKFEVNEDRESVIVPSKRLIIPGEKVTLLIEYNGTARMDGQGFYESWNHRENATEPPYISLLTQCEPARSRSWFPCFDEPDKKATFQLKIGHPLETNAYSNTRAQSMKIQNNMQVTHFESTVPLPTYLVAISITEQPVYELNVNDHKFRAIGHKGAYTAVTAAQALAQLQNLSIFAGVPFFPQKTDLLVVEDYYAGAMENPGLITYNAARVEILGLHVHEFAHMYFGNLVTLSTWNDIWVNEGFARFYERRQKPVNKLGYLSAWSISLHDLPIHTERTYTPAIYLDNSFGSNNHIHYEKAAQLIRMIRKFMGEEVFDRAIKNYLLDNAYGNGDATKIINHLLDEYEGDRILLQKMLNEWIYQPGIAVLFMKREEEHVVIEQTRFHSSYFDEQLRDEYTRFTIPLFCQIDGQPRTIVFDSGEERLIIPLSRNSTFTIENDYGDLFGVWSAIDDLPEENFDSEVIDWLYLSKNLVRSGLLEVSDFVQELDVLVKGIQRLNISTPSLYKYEQRDEWAVRAGMCKELGEEKMDAPMNKLFDAYLQEYNASILFCGPHATDRDVVKSLLHAKIITDDWKIRSDRLMDVIKIIEGLHPGATMEFVMESLQDNSTSFPLRRKLNQIINTVYARAGTVVDLETLHNFVRLHPKIAAEISHTIIQKLESVYLTEEFVKKNREMIEAVTEMVQRVHSGNNISSTFHLNSPTIDRIQYILSIY